MEAEVLVESLRLALSSLVQVEDSPFLMVASIVVPHSNCMSFFVFAALDVENLIVLPVDKLFVLILEDLEPS